MMEGAEGVDGSLGVVEVDKLQMSGTRPTSNETPCAELRGRCGMNHAAVSRAGSS